ncbi:MAG: winged helix-turn-helix transcriptional regulator [Lentisphaerae bacterium]|nr:winged helix-turn-helix transcriptional regulator [Lentisphaerota bacterium]
MNKTTTTELEHTWQQVMRLADSFNKCGKSDLPSRIPLSQLRVVGVIYERHPHGVMLKEIASELNLTPGAISQTVDILVREKLVERTTSPADRRAILLRPTAMGLELKEQHIAEINNMMSKITQNIPAEDFAVFSKVLDTLQAEITELQRTKQMMDQ